MLSLVKKIRKFHLHPTNYYTTLLYDRLLNLTDIYYL